MGLAFAVGLREPCYYSRTCFNYSPINTGVLLILQNAVDCRHAAPLCKGTGQGASATPKVGWLLPGHPFLAVLVAVVLLTSREAQVTPKAADSVVQGAYLAICLPESEALPKIWTLLVHM